jgi:hypothetical protein
MEMKYTLTGSRAVVGDESVAILDAFAVCDLGRHNEQMAQCFRVISLKIGEVRNVFARDYQNVNWCHGIDIMESNYLGVLVDKCRR